MDLICVFLLNFRNLSNFTTTALITTRDHLVSSEKNLLAMSNNPIKNNVFQPMCIFLLVGFSFIFILFLFIFIMEFFVKYKLSKRKWVKKQDIDYLFSRLTLSMQKLMKCIQIRKKISQVMTDVCLRKSTVEGDLLIKCRWLITFWIVILPFFSQSCNYVKIYNDLTSCDFLNGNISPVIVYTSFLYRAVFKRWTMLWIKNMPLNSERYLFSLFFLSISFTIIE